MSKLIPRKTKQQRQAAKITSTLAKVKSANGIGEMNQVEVFKAYMNRDSKITTALKQLTASLRSKPKQEGRPLVSVAALKEAVHNKTKMSYEDNIKSLVASGVQFDKNMSDRKICELILLDDWHTILKTALPYLVKYGAPAIKSLWDKHVKPRLTSYFGGDEGINPIDWGGPAGLQSMQQVPGLNVQMPGVKSSILLSTGSTGVSTHSIRSLLCPEVYKHRYTTIDTMKTALGTYTVEYDLTTNASGVVGAVLNPLALVGAGGDIKSFLNVFNDSTFTVAGAQTPSSTTTAGPFLTSLASIDTFRVCGFAWELKPIASISTTGSYVMSYNNRVRSNKNTATSMGISLSTMRLMPYSVITNNRVNSRMVLIHGSSAGESDFLDASALPSVTQQVFIIGSGLPASSVTAKLSINVVIEFIPTTASFPVCVVDYPQPGPMTEQFEAMLFARFPVLQSLTKEDARRVTMSLPENPMPFDSMLALIDELVTGITPAEVPALTMEQPYVGPGYFGYEGNGEWSG